MSFLSPISYATLKTIYHFTIPTTPTTAMTRSPQPTPETSHRSVRSKTPAASATSKRARRRRAHRAARAELQRVPGARFLFAHGAAIDDGVFFNACELRSAPVFEFLLACGWDINHSALGGRTALR
jgi:hypothetical protein